MKGDEPHGSTMHTSRRTLISTLGRGGDYVSAPICICLTVRDLISPTPGQITVKCLLHADSKTQENPPCMFFISFEIFSLNIMEVYIDMRSIYMCTSTSLIKSTSRSTTSQCVPYPALRAWRIDLFFCMRHGPATKYKSGFTVFKVVQEHLSFQHTFCQGQIPPGTQGAAAITR